jgi:cytochrome c peroxidase
MMAACWQRSNCLSINNQLKPGLHGMLLTIGAVFCSMSYGCRDESVDDNIAFTPTPYLLEFGGLPVPNIPEDNKLTEEGVSLGRKLFYEKRLSGDNTLACGSCHKQSLGFSDSAQFSIGIDGLPGKRQAMVAFNTLWHSNEFFWDGRAHLLRDQSLLPIQDPLEMHETLDNVIAKLTADTLYPEWFAQAFGTPGISAERISLALEQFMHSIVSYNSKYDKYQNGTATLTASEERGRVLFFAEYNPFFPDLSGADCAHCHSGSNFENDQYMNNGLDSDASMLDMGREAVTGNPADKGRFKVPTLRNIEMTAPYMHDGRFTTLEQVVDHYNEGLQASSTLEPHLENTRESGLLLTEQDKQDLIAFLKTLTDYSMLEDEKYSDPFE